MSFKQGDIVTIIPDAESLYLCPAGVPLLVLKVEEDTLVVQRLSSNTKRKIAQIFNVLVSSVIYQENSLNNTNV